MIDWIDSKCMKGNEFEINIKLRTWNLGKKAEINMMASHYNNNSPCPLFFCPVLIIPWCSTWVCARKELEIGTNIALWHFYFWTCLIVHSLVGNCMKAKSDEVSSKISFDAYIIKGLERRRKRRRNRAAWMDLGDKGIRWGQKRCWSHSQPSQRSPSVQSRFIPRTRCRRQPHHASMDS